ncbi:MAG: S8 family serine peptidase [Caldilineaceae bacterium]|nr:S8 family serine peptidase [Caldilineaceae bacterium]
MDHPHRDLARRDLFRAFTRFVTALLVLLALLPTAARAQTPDAAISPEDQANLFGGGPPPIPPFVPGVVLVGVRDDLALAAAVLDELQATAVDSLDLRGLDGGQGSGGVGGLRLQVPPGQEWTAIERLQQQPGVVFAEPDWLAQIAEAPVAVETPAQAAAAETPFVVDDTLYMEQWYAQRINLSRAYALAQAAGPGDPIRVVMVDTGVDYMHPDLANRLLPGRNYITNIPGVAPAPDDNGHGTHIAGLIGALTNNGKGMAGTALDVVLEPYKTFRADGYGDSTSLAQAVRDAVDADPPADIVNLSLTLVGTADSTPLRTAVAYAISKGALVVAAAGNCDITQTGCPVFYPGAYPGVLTVGATTYADVPAYYSAAGSELDLVAPGGGSGPAILSTWSKLTPNCKETVREVDGGRYCTKTGTSTSTALVSGVAALVWSMNRDLSAAQVGEILRAGAAPLNFPPNQVGAGRLDAAAALRAALPAQITVSQNSLRVAAVQGGAPQQAALTLENPSLDPITWTLSTTRALDWLAIDNPAGSVRYGEPAQAGIVITPTQLTLGQHKATLLLTSSRSGGPQVQQMISVDVAVHGPLTPRSHLPLIARQAVGAWLEPGPEGRTAYDALTGSASTGITLPFTLEARGQTLTEARLFADGFIAFPASLPDPNRSLLPNRCLANQLWPQAAIYGWWADLEPGAVGSRVSTFQPDPDRFVIEYADVPSAAGVVPAYVVSFQIVLHRSGRIDLNYGALPDGLTPPPQATVGAQVQTGRFYNQIACRTAGFSVGSLPHSYDMITLDAKDLY